MDTELKIQGFTFMKDVWANEINMEWVNPSNYHYHSNEDMDIQLNKEELIALCRFIRHNIKFSNEEFNHAFRTY